MPTFILGRTQFGRNNYRMGAGFQLPIDFSGSGGLLLARRQPILRARFFDFVFSHHPFLQFISGWIRQAMSRATRGKEVRDGSPDQAAALL